MTDRPPSIPLAPPNIGAAERALVDRALRSPDIAYGPIVDEFEREVAALLGRRHGIALISGTAALHLALLACGVAPDDEVLMPTLTFVAPAHATRYVGARPVVFDAERRYRQLDVARLDTWLAGSAIRSTSGAVNQRTRRRISAMIAVDLLGHPTDLTAIRAVLKPYGIPLIDDAAEALGARLHGRPVGSGADVVCLSFNANKIVTTGGGGMLLCDEDEIAMRVRHLASQAKAAGDAYDHSEVGFNYRLPSAAAALGLGQLRRLDEFLLKKRAISDRYRAGLHREAGLRLPREAAGAQSTDWLYTVHLDEDAGLDAAFVRRMLGERGIATRPMFTPLHLTRAHQGSQAHEMPVAEELLRTGVILPSSTLLTDSDQDRVIDALRDAVAHLRPSPAHRP